MTTNIATAIAINAVILLIGSWVFAAFIILSINKEKQRLKDLLQQDQKNGSKKSASPTIGEITEENAPVLEKIEETLREKELGIATLLNMQNHQKSLLKDINSGNLETISTHTATLEADNKQVQHLISSLERDLEKSQIALSSMQESDEDRLVRINTLEKTERRMRDEIKKLKRSTAEHTKEINAANIKNNDLRDENGRLKRTVASLATASKEQLAVIKQLHDEVERAAELEDHQRELIEDLEKRLNNERNNGNDDEKVKVMETELENLQDTLKRTLIEKEFIEGHMIELDDSLEKAKETEEALERARKEIATLEKHFPDFEPTPRPKANTTQTVKTEADSDLSETNINTIKESSEEAIPFTTEIEELNDIIEDNRLFGALQEFWSTLDTPPLNLKTSNQTDPPNSNEHWVRIDIGEKDYGFLFSVNTPLAEIVTQAIFKGSSDTEGNNQINDAVGELANIVAGTLATELENNLTVSIPEHINMTQANDLLNSSTLVANMIATAKGEPIYAALIIEGEK